VTAPSSYVADDDGGDGPETREEIAEELRRGGLALALAENASVVSVSYARDGNASASAYYADVADDFLEAAHRHSGPAFAALTRLLPDERRQVASALRSHAEEYLELSRRRTAEQAGTVTSVARHLEVIAEAILLRAA
jgi:hypothetical protein